MKTLPKNDTKKTQIPIAASKPKTPSAPTKSESKPEVTETKQADDTVTLSKTSDANSDKTKSEERGQDKGFASFLDNFKNGFADVTEEKKKPGLGELKGKELKEKLDSLPKEQKEQTVLDSLKGLKGEELKNRLAELDKVDKELADKLREKLGLKTEDKLKPEDKNKAEEAKPVEKAAESKKASEGDTGAPSETFLWKPQSESDGKLVILLPTSVSARSVTISGPNVNQTVSKGGRNGKRANGQREHFRFGKGGKDMQGPVQVTVQLENGQKKTMNIANPAQRNEGGKLQDSGQRPF